MTIDEVIQSQIVTDKLIVDFDLVEPYSNFWEKERQLEYWIGDIIDSAEELQIRIRRFGGSHGPVGLGSTSSKKLERR